MKSSDCDNWNHQDCYNSKGTCSCDCHDPKTVRGKKYNKIRKSKREKKWKSVSNV